VKTQQIFSIRCSRLPSVDANPGLVLLVIDGADAMGRPRQIGAVTDVAFRGRLAHYDLHSANEVAAIRKALRPNDGEVVIREGWSDLGSLLHFWHDFVGSRIRPIAWSCESCAASYRENVGGSVGETFSRACRCGRVARITVASDLPSMRPAAPH
jgi:hypothetical protein